MSAIIPYSNLAEDPTTEAIIYWVDDRDEADGGAQTLHYGDDETDLNQSESDSDPNEVPSLDGTYLYVAVIDGLEPDTRYYAEIRGGSDTLETCQWVTLPDSLEDRDVTIAISSDWHKDFRDSGDQYMNPEEVEVIWDQEPDIHLFAGDYLTNSDTTGTEIAEEWVHLFKEYYDRYDDEELVHILAIPGNHEVGNDQWDGTTAESVNPSAGYLQFFYGNPRLLHPVGENYGQITVSDYLQILALDTHSAYPEDVAEWMHINSGVPFVIPIQHEGFVQMGDRDNNDLRDNIRRAWFRKFYETNNVFFWQHGHVHTEGRSVPLKVVESEPSGDEYFELDDGYVVEADDTDGGLVGFGEGWRDDRSLRDEWFIDRVEGGKNFTIAKLSNPTMDVTIYDNFGSVIDSESFNGEYGDFDPAPAGPPNGAIFRNSTIRAASLNKVD